LLVATNLLTTKLYSCHVKESESDTLKRPELVSQILERSESNILPPILQPCMQHRFTLTNILTFHPPMHLTETPIVKIYIPSTDVSEQSLIRSEQEGALHLASK